MGLTFEEKCDALSALNPEALLADGFEDALIGMVKIAGLPILALYDTELCIAILMQDGMTEEEALEHFDYNVLGSYVGESTPAFTYTYPETEMEKYLVVRFHTEYVFEQIVYFEEDEDRMFPTPLGLTGIKEGTVVKFRYKNWEGKMGIRNVLVKGFNYGITAYHPMPELFLSGFDLDKEKHRDFAYSGIYEMAIIGQEEN